ncbi:ATP-binding cassette sub-family C member 3-like [Physella acuta]|uniref:ATP-binding cassette sub-family C member 3-like n=1 Tax=Physella acuta TaxID=109671 RepID=UPI0027DE1DE5|nr:ATP-binding cassette sub-family C member 3-like [Physella acuta]
MLKVCTQHQLWDSSLAWSNNTWPELSECFQNTVLELAPAFWFLLTTPCYWYHMLTSSRDKHPVCWIFIAKLILSSCLGAADITWAVALVTEETVSEQLLVILVHMFMLMFYIGTIVLEKSRNVVRSFPMFVYWSLASFCLLVKIFEKGMSGDHARDTFNFSLVVVRYVATTGILVVTCFAEYHGAKGMIKVKTKSTVNSSPSAVEEVEDFKYIGSYIYLSSSPKKKEQNE